MRTIIDRDVIVVGAGPAGAICASYLSKAGLDVLMLDKETFPRDKVCGDMVREGIMKHIEALDAVEALDKMSACIRKIKLISSAGSEAVMPFECYAVPRFYLDKLLVDTAVSWGVEFRQGCTVTGFVKESGKICGVKVMQKGTESILRSRMVIRADGVVSEKADAAWIGQRAYFKGIKFEKSFSKEQYDAGGIFAFDDKEGPAYFWIIPVGPDGVKRGICNVGMIVKGRDSHKISNLEQRMADWLESSEKIKTLFENAEQLSPWKFGRLVDVNEERRLVKDGAVFVGDAAAQIFPLLNDGLSAAADTAKAAADAAIAAFDAEDFSEESLLADYDNGLKKQTDDEVKLDKLLMESMHDPKVMDKIVEKLARK
ncbi:MAG: NAD(P)/FAD-dependent oxidoreductase [Bacillota bacterium]|nr:NAD(P)/FAD-dependent oxidoreductase [Bacillota bacterium]